MRNWINLVESPSTIFYHGSGQPLEAGTILTASKGSKFVRRRKLSIMQTEAILENVRPLEMLSRKQSVFLVSDPAMIKAAGGLEDYVYEVEPIGRIEKSHNGWWGLINSQFYNWASVRSSEEAIHQYAVNYWTGVDCPARGAWEYRCMKARII